MIAMTPEQLKRHKLFLDAVTHEELDRRLEALLLYCYATLQVQNQ